jgi:hypothetical protein
MKNISQENLFYYFLMFLKKKPENSLERLLKISIKPNGTPTII